MKKLFQIDPIMELVNCRQLRMIGDYNFVEASEKHCKFFYENFLVTINAEEVHINVLKDEEILVHVEKLNHFTLERQVNEDKTLR